MKLFAALLLVILSASAAQARRDVPDYPTPDEDGYCETYEDDCERDNDDDGWEDNTEDDGRGF